MGFLTQRPEFQCEWAPTAYARAIFGAARARAQKRRITPPRHAERCSAVETGAASRHDCARRRALRSPNRELPSNRRPLAPLASASRPPARASRACPRAGWLCRGGGPLALASTKARRIAHLKRTKLDSATRRPGASSRSRGLAHAATGVRCLHVPGVGCLFRTILRVGRFNSRGR